MKKIIIILIVFELTGCKFNNSNKNADNTVKVQPDTVILFSPVQEEADMYDTVLLYPPVPEKLDRYLKKQFPDYKFLNRTGKLQEYEQWILRDHPHPFFAQGDFNGDGETDYVLVLEDDSGKLKIIAFNSGNDSYEPYFMKYSLLQYYEQYNNEIQIVLEPEGKGEFTVMGVEDEVLQIENDYFGVAFSEDSLTLYVRWNGKEYEGLNFDLVFD
jgi:hypothetical protein